ncbi:hypothetical protein, partial [Massilia terrae]
MDADAGTQHTAPVSSNSPQKELDFKPAVWWAFFLALSPKSVELSLAVTISTYKKLRWERTMKAREFEQ